MYLNVIILQIQRKSSGTSFCQSLKKRWVFAWNFNWNHSEPAYFTRPFLSSTFPPPFLFRSGCSSWPQVKHIMEEAVTRKFVHEDSSNVTSLCCKLLLQSLEKLSLQRHFPAWHVEWGREIFFSCILFSIASSSFMSPFPSLSFSLIFVSSRCCRCLSLTRIETKSSGSFQDQFNHCTASESGQKLWTSCRPL